MFSVVAIACNSIAIVLLTVACYRDHHSVRIYTQLLQ